MKHLTVLLLTITLTSFSTFSFSQVVNGYAKVTAIAGSVLTIANSDETGDTFEDGENVIILQMQDDVIGTNIGDNSSFGNLGSIASAGMYEVATISSHTESGGLPVTITLVGGPSNSYNIGANSSVQIITYPSFGSPNYTTVADMSAKSWDGNTGGVLAFSVSGILTLANNISADEAGFRGADIDAGISGSCNGDADFRVVSGELYGDKGEGIYKSTTATYAAGMGKILNGGGGANSHNAGGGGGSSFSAGGQGGPGYPDCSPSPGGLGGIDLSGQISSERVFMGGGGGGGEGNNGGVQQGGNGGGIIFIKATEIRTTGSCGGLSITANGESVVTGSVQDGNGAGGAGGSIVFEVDSWNVAGTCLLTIQVNGGDGGDVIHAVGHGAGAGGGLGAVIYSTAQPTTNITTNTAPGLGGRNCNTCSYASDGVGADGDGILEGNSSALPIELIHFSASKKQEAKVHLTWATATEKKNDFFTIERSTNGRQWEVLTRLKGAGTSNSAINYSAWDNSPLKGTSYYRLKQTDFDGRSSYSIIRSVTVEAGEGFAIYPNPAQHEFIVAGKELEEATVSVFNMLGQQANVVPTVNSDKLVFNTLNMVSGTYFIIVEKHGKMEMKKLVVDKK